MPIDPKTTALLLIEYQNDFTTEGGALHNGVKAVMESTTMLANSAQLLADRCSRGRCDRDVSSYFVSKGYREITSEPYGIRKGVVDTKAFVRASWGAESLIHSPHSEATLSDGGCADGHLGETQSAPSGCA